MTALSGKLQVSGRIERRFLVFSRKQRTYSRMPLSAEVDSHR